MASHSDPFMQAAIAEAIAYAKHRETFGQPIANYQAIQWMLADMATELEAARLLTWKAAAGRAYQERGAVDAAMAKVAASEAAHQAADRAMQILASAGYRRGSVAERLFRDVRAVEIRSPHVSTPFRGPIELVAKRINSNVEG